MKKASWLSDAEVLKIQAETSVWLTVVAPSSPSAACLLIGGSFVHLIMNEYS